MSVKKSAIYTGTSTDINGIESTHRYTIEQLDDNSIIATPNSNIAQLRMLAKYMGFEYDSKWNTQNFGSKFIDFIHAKDPNSVMLSDTTKKMAFIRDKDYKHTIEQLDGDTKTITVKADSTIAVLRLIFNELGETFDENWNTQTMGSKLIELINSQPKTKTSPTSTDDDNGDDEVDKDTIWNWWLNLHPDLKYSFLRSDSCYLHNHFKANENYVLEVYYKPELQNDKKYFYVQVADEYYYGSTLDIFCSASKEGGSLEWSCTDVSDLALLPNLISIYFKIECTLFRIPKGLGKLKKLDLLSFAGVDYCGKDNPEQEIQELSKILQDLPKLRYLSLVNTPLAVYLNENNDVLQKLQALNPNCNIWV